MTRRTTPLYVQALNKAQEGPYTLEEALSAAKGHHYISDSEKDRVVADYEAGGAGPWHFQYGFKDITIRVGPEVMGATVLNTASSTPKVLDAYITIRGIVYELANAIGAERARAQLQLLLDTTAPDPSSMGVADAAISEIVRMLAFDLREGVSAEGSIEAIQEVVAGYDVQLAKVQPRAA